VSWLSYAHYNSMLFDCFPQGVSTTWNNHFSLPLWFGIIEELFFVHLI
jgi:hypothetical protein